MNTRRMLGGAAVLASLLCSTAAMAKTNIWTPVSGAGFRPSTGTQAKPQHVPGSLVNYSTTLTTTAEASLGHNGRVATSLIVQGYNNGGTVTCEVLAAPDSQGGQVRFQTVASTSIVGDMALWVGIDTSRESFPAYFYTVRCTLPPRNANGPASIYGVHPFNGGTLLTPASVAGFVPISYDSPSNIVEVSLGYFAGGQTGFVLDGKIEVGSLTCTVYAQNSAQGISAFSASTSLLGGGFVALNTVATLPSNQMYFYSMRCVPPTGFDMRGYWPGR